MNKLEQKPIVSKRAPETSIADAAAWDVLATRRGTTITGDLQAGLPLILLPTEITLADPPPKPDDKPAEPRGPAPGGPPGPKAPGGPTRPPR